VAKQPIDVPSRSGAYWLLLALSALVLVAGIVLAATGRTWSMLAVGCGSVIVVAAAWPILKAIEESRAANLRCMSDFVGPFDERMQQMNVLLNLISEQQLISDRTKMTVSRTRDREALRRAIHEEVNNKDWEAALALANDMEQVFGYRQEADRFRRDIEGKRLADLRHHVNEGIAVIDRHVRAEKWQEALAEAHRISQQFPGDEQAHNLPQVVEDRRAQHKRQLMESWQDAINRHDIDGSIEILRKLDPYLTPQEAEAMQEPARNLFKEKLNALRTQITLAVQDHNWAEAIRLGDEITRDFPNTRAAQEVREMMPALRERLSGAGSGAEPAATPA
jgi:hypothetical protein